MKKHVRTAGLALVGLAALVVVLGAAGKGNDGPAVLTDESSFGADPVASAIDLALGREAVVAKQGGAAESTAGRNAPAPVATAAAGGAARASTGAPAPDVMAMGSLDDRKIVQTASVKLQVKDVGGSFGDIGRIAAGAGGFVASSNFAFQGEQQVASVTIRVPSKSYQDVLAEVRALGAKVDGETSNASDVTEEYSDLAARIRNLEASETQLLQLLSQAKNVTEILQVQDRINSTRTQIEQAKGRILLLDKLSDLATISVSLRPLAIVAKADGGRVDLGEEISQAWADSLDFLASIAGGVVSVLVFSWWLIPLSIPAAVAWQRWTRGRPAAA